MKVTIRKRTDTIKKTFMVEVSFNGRRQRKNFDSLSDAEAYRDQLLSQENKRQAAGLLREIGVNLGGESSIEKKGISEAMREFYEDNCRTKFEVRHMKIEKNRYNTFGLFICNVRGREFVDEITLRDLEDFRAEMIAGTNPLPSEIGSTKVKRRKGVKPATAERTMASVKAFLNYCVLHKYIRETPAKGMKKLFIEDVEKELFDEKSKSALFDACTNWVKDFLTVMDETACRPIELERLAFKDIDWGRQLVTLTSAKGNRVHARQVPLTLTAMQVLRTVQMLRRHEGRAESKDLVFRNSKGNAVTTNALCIAVRDARAAAGISEGLSSYSLRHTNITSLVNAGAGLGLVSMLAGHRKLQTTKTYIHSNGDDLRNVINLRDELKKKKASVG